MSGATPLQVNVNSSRRRALPFMRGVASARALVDFTAEDEQVIRRHADVLLPHADAIARELYQRLLLRPETAPFFSLPSGRPDRAGLVVETEHLRDWLRRVIQAPLDEQTLSYSVGVGQAYARRERGSQSLPGRYMVVTMAMVFDALCPLLDSHIADRREMAATIGAWNKLLTIHLDLFLAVYGAAAGSSHWY